MTVPEGVTVTADYCMKIFLMTCVELQGKKGKKNNVTNNNINSSGNSNGPPSTAADAFNDDDDGGKKLPPLDKGAESRLSGKDAADPGKKEDGGGGGEQKENKVGQGQQIRAHEEIH